MSSPAQTTDPAPPRPDRRAARRQETMDEIVAAAWDIVREQGLAGLSMRDLGDRVGMKAQSIYSYFASKHEIYDAMFHGGYKDFAATMADIDDSPTDASGSGDGHRTSAHRTSAHRAAHLFFTFCTSDPVRYQLLFQRTIPDFTPSPESYAVALEAYDAVTAHLGSFGITDPEAVDLWTAMLTGLTDQQISNDPGGDRWQRTVDRAVDMLLRELAPSLSDPTTQRNPQ